MSWDFVSLKLLIICEHFLLSRSALFERLFSCCYIPVYPCSCQLAFLLQSSGTDCNLLNVATATGSLYILWYIVRVWNGWYPVLWSVLAQKRREDLLFLYSWTVSTFHYNDTVTARCWCKHDMWVFNVNIQEPGACLNNSQIQNKF